MTDLWNDNTPITDYEIDVPTWIAQDISAYDIAAILQGGCASGAYMPAVTYHQAAKTMAEHGDNVLEYLEGAWGELPQPEKDTSWSGMACMYLSCAVEAWVSSVEPELSEIIAEKESEEQ